MKIYTIIAVAALFVATGSAAEKGVGGEMKKLIKECAKELKDKALADGPPSNPQAIAAMFVNPKNRCMVKCVLEKMNVIDTTGNVAADKFREKVPFAKKVEEKIIADCADKTKATADLCQRAFDVTKCVITSKIPAGI